MHRIDHTLMQNEQCGICWNLEFDKQGDKTHKALSKNSHNFVPLDYCLKCREPKFDSHGYQTHPGETRDFMHTQQITKSHGFISGMKAMDQGKQKRQNRVFTYIGIASIGLGAVSGAITLFS